MLRVQDLRFMVCHARECFGGKERLDIACQSLVAKRTRALGGSRAMGNRLYKGSSGFGRVFEDWYGYVLVACKGLSRLGFGLGFGVWGLGFGVWAFERVPGTLNEDFHSCSGFPG